MPGRNLAGVAHWARSSLAKMSARVDPRGSALRGRSLKAINSGVMRYRWNGVECYKNPLDLALYGLLLSELRPQTIIEIGSASGGSALWFAGQLRALAIEGSVYSFDIKPPNIAGSSSVTFSFGDIFRLEESDLPLILDSCDRPLLVIEDGPHTYEACSAALAFFDRFLRPGDYIVIEDGNVRELGKYWYRNGPNRAVRDFLNRRPAAYKADRRLCDFFGRNMTGNTDGYLRRVA